MKKRSAADIATVAIGIGVGVWFVCMGIAIVVGLAVGGP